MHSLKKVNSARVIRRQKKGEKTFDMSLRQKDVERLLLTQPLKRFREESKNSNFDFPGLLMSESRIVRLRDGEILFTDDVYGDSCFILLSGQINAYLPKSAKQSRRIFAHADSKRSLWSAFQQLFDSHQLKERRDVSTYMSNKDRGLITQQNSVHLMSDMKELEANFTLSRMYQPSDMIGHISAMARTPRYELALSKGSSELLELKWQALRELNRNVPKLSSQIQEDYRGYGLKNFLATIPELTKVNAVDLNNLVTHAEFHSCGKPDWNLSFKKHFMNGDSISSGQKIKVVGRGDRFEHIYIVRSGFVFIDNDQTPVYKTRGAIIGLEESYWEKAIFEHDIYALAFAEIIAIPKNLLENFVFKSKSRYSTKSKIAVTQLYGESLLVNGRKSMLINLDRCTECDDCVTACANAHGGNPRFVRQGPSVAQFMTANACMHCKDPVCMVGCPTGAIRRSSNDGIVLINDQLCIGCSACANSCPYGNIQMSNIADEQGRLLVDEQHKPIMKAMKCDLCIDQKTGPACQNACPNGALKRIDIELIDNQAASWIKA